MTAPSLLEKVQMCIAEAGYDPSHVYGPPDNPVILNDDDPSRGVPVEAAWRAFGLSSPEPAPCWECWNYGCERTSDCLADRSLVLDCGRTR